MNRYTLHLNCLRACLPKWNKPQCAAIFIRDCCNGRHVGNGYFMKSYFCGMSRVNDDLRQQNNA